MVSIFPDGLNLQDQSGKQQSLKALLGGKGAAIFFVRSADWCPFCKKQLQDALAKFHTEAPPLFWPRNLRRLATLPHIVDNARLLAATWVAHAESPGVSGRSQLHCERLDGGGETDLQDQTDRLHGGLHRGRRRTACDELSLNR